METTVIINDLQEIDAADLMALQGYSQAATDHLIADAIASGLAYTGLTVTETDPTTLSVASGRLYHEGAVYAAAATGFSLTSRLPASQKRALAVVVWGGTVDEATEPRDYLVDLDTNLTETQAHPTRRARKGTVEILAGVAGADPAMPTIPADAIAVARIIVTTTAIESITQLLELRLPNLVSQATANVDLVFALPARTWVPTYNPDGSIDTVAETLNGGETRDSAFAYNPDGSIDTLVITTSRWQRTEAYTYDAGGNVDSVTITTEEV